MQSKTEKKGQNSKNCDTNIIDFNTVPTIMPCCKMIIANNVSHGKLETVVYLEIINKDCRALLLVLFEVASQKDSRKGALVSGQCEASKKSEFRSERLTSPRDNLQ